MRIIHNPCRGDGLHHRDLADVPFPGVDAAAPLALLARCPRAGATPLLDAPSVATACDVAKVSVKDERDRMGLGSFKALGAAYVIARDAARGAARGQVYVTASAGNHGLSVAAGAAAFAAHAVIYLAETVPEVFAQRLRAMGAEVVRAGADYEASMTAAMQGAQQSGAILLSDSSWPGYTARPHVVMQGYLVLMAEVFDRIATPPTHLILQAGVGGLAGATEAPLVAGDVLMLDTGVVRDGYFCDFDRNWSLGPATRETTSAYARLIEASEAGFAAARPGATTADLFHAMDAVLTGGAGGSDAGRYGHGLGMQLTEWPSLIPADRTVLEPGMVLTLEPGLDLGPGRTLVHEENIVITDTGARCLSAPAPRVLPEI